MKRKSITYLILFIFTLTSCVNQQAGEQVQPDSNDTTMVYPIQEANQEAVESPANPVQGETGAITLSYVQDRMSDEAKLVTEALNSDSHYASLPVEPETTLKSQVRIDDEENVYFAYGQSKNSFVKLGPDVTVEEIELPFAWYFQSVWIGDQLIVPYNKEIYIIKPTMEIEIVPGFADLPEVTYSANTLGLSNDNPPLALWLAQSPVRSGEEMFAAYQTFDPVTKAVESYELPIPWASENWGGTEDSEISGERLGSIVRAVDTESKNALICYGTRSTEGESFTIHSHLELYDTQKASSIKSEDTCCINRVFDFAGEFYSSAVVPESCSFNIIQRLSDGSDLVDISNLGDGVKPQKFHWVGSNGDLFVYLNPSVATVMNHEGKVLKTFDLPATELNKCGTNVCVGISLPFYPQK